VDFHESRLQRDGVRETAKKAAPHHSGRDFRMPVVAALSVKPLIPRIMMYSQSKLAGAPQKRYRVNDFHRIILATPTVIMIRERISAWLHSVADSVGGLGAQADRETQSNFTDFFAQISLSAEDRLAQAEKEVKEREEMGLLSGEVPRQWHSRYYMQQGYCVSASANQSSVHWRGGAPQHDGADCPICKKPLLLFWDIDCRDPRFRNESTDLFGELERLPLYYCCRRPEATIYQVVDLEHVRAFRPELRDDEESPFAGFPDIFERKALQLGPIPRDVANLLVIVNEFSSDWLNAEEWNRISKFLGAEADSKWDIKLSQFGGAPGFTQGHVDIDCPNPDCPTPRMGHPLLRNERLYKMKELAVIDMDAGFEMDKCYSQIVFHICWKCLTIHADYRCT